MSGYRELKPEELAWRLDDTEVRPPARDIEAGMLGQERALRALDFGLGIKGFGYNIFVMGQVGVGKASTVDRVVGERASNEGAGLRDWVYVMDFRNPEKPKFVDLPRGTGRALEEDMDRLVARLKQAIPKAFEGEEFEKKRAAVTAEFNALTTAVIEEVETAAGAREFSLEKGPHGLVLIPRKKDGSLMSEAEFEAQPKDEKDRIEKVGSELQVTLSEAMRKVRELDKDMHARLKDMFREVGMFAAGHSIDELVDKYGVYPKMMEYLEEVREDIVGHIEDFRSQSEGPQTPFMPRQEPSFDKYKVNLVVDNSGVVGAPVVHEPNPTYANLFGRVEQKVQYGMASTDFTMIKAGALHRANGGYLILNAMDVLKSPFSYEGLKRALKTRTLAVEDALEQYRMMPLYSIKPEPVPLDVKVILVGQPTVYYLLNAYDEEFKGLFKVHADFDSRVDRTDNVVSAYAAFIGQKVSEEGLLPFDASGVARVVEYSARLTSDKEKLSLKLVDVLDILRESSYWAGKAGSASVRRDDVDKAVDEGVFRSSLLEDKIRQAIREGVVMVDIEGEKVGQVNGLSVMTLGGYSFGRPSRITARAYMGKSGMVNIEREVKMSGPIHDKGVLILTGFLGDRYASDKPLAVSASIAFEQSYDGIEGDSASSTELYALMSALSGLPIRQGIAVTGSVNQMGEVQPIGGVNEKVEGYFHLCKELGLTGAQGVMVPESNVRHLMLKDEVVQAVRDGKFHLWAVKTIDGGVEVLTGRPAGERDSFGRWPVGTVNFLVDRRLADLAKGMKKFMEEDKDSEKPTDIQERKAG